MYRDLERQGNVYHNKVPLNYKPLISLLEIETKIPKEKLFEIINMKFKKTEKTQSRSIEKYNTQYHLLRLATFLSTIYNKEFKSCTPRVKISKKTKELLDCKSGLRNVYPINYTKYIKEFLVKYPLEKWCLKYVATDDIKGFEEVTIDNIIKYKCLTCDKLLLKVSRKSHLKIHLR
jgi:hypothetical protein